MTQTLHLGNRVEVFEDKSMHYVHITDASFLSGLLNDGDIWQCNLVTSKWVVDHGYGFYSDAAGDAATPPWDGDDTDVPAPTLERSVVTDTNTSLITLNFTGNIQITDATGITVTVDAVGNTVVSAVATGDNLAVTLTTPIAAGQDVLFSYDADTGSLLAAGAGNAPVADITDAVVTNSVT